jgi:hypothetical protein
MKNGRLLALLVVLAAAAGFAAGWWYRDRSGDSIERRTKEAAEHMRDAVRSLTH